MNSTKDFSFFHECSLQSLDYDIKRIFLNHLLFFHLFTGFIFLYCSVFLLICLFLPLGTSNEHWKKVLNFRKDVTFISRDMTVSVLGMLSILVRYLKRQLIFQIGWLQSHSAVVDKMKKSRFLLEFREIHNSGRTYSYSFLSFRYFPFSKSQSFVHRQLNVCFKEASATLCL